MVNYVFRGDKFVYFLIVKEKPEWQSASSVVDWWNTSEHIPEELINTQKYTTFHDLNPFYDI